jgi:hypothetical protein
MSPDTDLFGGAVPPDLVTFSFVAPGAYDRPRPFALEVLPSLPEGAQAWLDAPVALLDALRARSPFVRIAADRGLVTLTRHSRHRLGPGLFAARVRHQMRLLVQAPADVRRYGGEVAVRQLYEDVEVGRVTFRLRREPR